MNNSDPLKGKKIINKGSFVVENDKDRDVLAKYIQMLA